jgi:hypothetical protein
MSAHSSRGWTHAASVETFGPKRRTIVAVNEGMPGMTTIGIPLPDGGWQYVIVAGDGRWTNAEAETRQVAQLKACQDLDIDPVPIMGREAVRRAQRALA